MKKFVKGCLIIAGTLLCVGTVCLGVSAATGGIAQAKQLAMKGELNLWGNSVVGEEFLTQYTDQDGVVHYVDYDDDWDDWDDYDDDWDDYDDDWDDYDDDWDDLHNIERHNRENMTQAEREVEFNRNREILQGDYKNDNVASRDSISNLDIELGGALFKIAAWDGDTFKIEGKNMEQFQCYVDGQKLAVKGKKMDWGSNVNVSERSLTLYIPSGKQFREVDIDLGAGRVEADSLVADEMDISVGAGEIQVGSLLAIKADIQVGAGECIIEKGTFTEADMEVSMGSIHMKSGSITGNLDGKCAMGNITLQLAGSETDHNYEVACSAGEVKVGSTTWNGLGYKQHINHGATSTFELECAMGNIVIAYQ